MSCYSAKKLSLVLSAICLFVAGCSSNPPTPATTAAPAPATTTSTPERIPGPVEGTRMTPEYVASVGRAAYLWAWPMVNIHNRMVMFDKLPGPGLMGGIVPVAPPNQLSMLHDYVEPQERIVACPNQDVVYGFSILALDREPVVIQVPDFGSRFWVYQVVDQRTDGFASLGKMYGTKPGFYLLAGPGWSGQVPSGIAKVFHATTKLGIVIPRVFKGSDDADTKALQPLINQIDIYPLSKFDDKMKTTDWANSQKFPNASAGQEETRWVIPEQFAAEFPGILDEVPPMPGEEAMYANFRGTWEAAAKDQKLMDAITKAAVQAENEIVKPLFEFRNYGLPLPNNWTTQNNGAEFGTDYYTRLAVAKSNIFVNKPNETKYFYQDLDSSGVRLNGKNKYTVTFPSGQIPPVQGFWSLTLYNKFHFFEPNDLNRYSLGTKNAALQKNADGSLTIYISSTPPADKNEMYNWLPAPKDDFSLYVRTYWPEQSILDGHWTPPAVERSK